MRANGHALVAVHVAHVHALAARLVDREAREVPRRTPPARPGSRGGPARRRGSSARPGRGRAGSGCRARCRSGRDRDTRARRDWRRRPAGGCGRRPARSGRTTRRRAAMRAHGVLRRRRPAQDLLDRAGDAHPGRRGCRGTARGGARRAAAAKASSRVVVSLPAAPSSEQKPMISPSVRRVERRRRLELDVEEAADQAVVAVTRAGRRRAGTSSAATFMPASIARGRHGVGAGIACQRDSRSTRGAGGGRPRGRRGA